MWGSPQNQSCRLRVVENGELCLNILDGNRVTICLGINVSAVDGFVRWLKFLSYSNGFRRLCFKYDPEAFKYLSQPNSQTLMLLLKLFQKFSSTHWLKPISYRMKISLNIFPGESITSFLCIF